MGIKIKNPGKIKSWQRARRVARVRAKISGTAERPRLAVFRSLKHTSAQLIDDAKGKTIVAASDKEIKAKTKGKVAAAAAVGQILAEKAKKAGIGAVVLDRRSYRYHGRVQALADAAREAGLKF